MSGWSVLFEATAFWAVAVAVRTETWGSRKTSDTSGRERGVLRCLFGALEKRFDLALSEETAILGAPTLNRQQLALAHTAYQYLKRGFLGGVLGARRLSRLCGLPCPFRADRTDDHTRVERQVKYGIREHGVQHLQFGLGTTVSFGVGSITTGDLRGEQLG